MEKEQRTQDTASHMDDVKTLIAELGNLIDKSATLKDMNFGVFYQHGRLGFVDLDAFAESTKIRLTPDGEEKTLTEMQKSVDKEND